MFMGFVELIGEGMAAALEKRSITEPAEIQALAVPAVMAGGDVIIRSPAGSGKTLAFLLPIYMKLDISAKTTQALVMAPTYELAAQLHTVAAELWDLFGYDPGKPALFVGGANLKRQVEALRDKPRIVIGTPGRLAELLNLKKLSVHFVKTVVLDEGDRLMAEEQLPSVKVLLKAAMRDVQVVLASATLSGKAADTAESIMKEPVTVTAAGLDSAVTHTAVICQRREKYKALRTVIRSENITRGLLFLRSALEAEEAAERLNYHGIRTLALSSAEDGPARKAALNSLRDGGTAILAATDAAARGLDIQGLTHVINMDPPRDKTEYLHRAGRTGRMGKPGAVITLATENEGLMLRTMARSLNIDILYKPL